MIPFSNDYRYGPIRDAAALTTSYVAGNIIGAPQTPDDLTYFVGPNGCKDQLILYVDFTKGSLTTAEIKVEFNNDYTDPNGWYQETFDSPGNVSNGAMLMTEALMTRELAATGKYRIPIRVNDNYIRVSVKGTGTVTGSEMTVYAIMGNN